MRGTGLKNPNLSALLGSGAGAVTHSEEAACSDKAAGHADPMPENGPQTQCIEWTWAWDNLDKCLKKKRKNVTGACRRSLTEALHLENAELK